MMLMYHPLVYQPLSLINGSYSYSISSQNLSYHATGGTFTISGNTVYENVVFSKVLYLVTVNQKNLPIGYRWYFNTTSGITVMLMADVLATSRIPEKGDAL